jgi:DNA-binding MarR family transcriptional regulator
MILEYVIEHDSCTQKEIAKAMHITPASAAVTLKRIEKSGLIVRTTDANDSRKNHISVTEKGKTALKEFRKICDATDEDMFRDFSLEEREALHQLLVRLHKNLDSENFTQEEINELLTQSTPTKGAQK